MAWGFYIQDMDFIFWISSKSETKNFIEIEGSPFGFFFRLVSNPLHYRGSKNTNLVSSEFCKGKPVAPATCAAQTKNTAGCIQIAIRIYLSCKMILAESAHSSGIF